MKREKLLELANGIVRGLASGEIEFDPERWPNEIAFTPSYLEELLKEARVNHGEDFQEYLEWKKENGHLNWDQERIEALAQGRAFPTLKELDEYSAANPNDCEPDYIMFVPIIDGEAEVGRAVITVNGLFEYEFKLIEVFSNLRARTKIKLSGFSRL